MPPITKTTLPLASSTQPSSSTSNPTTNGIGPPNSKPANANASGGSNSTPLSAGAGTTEINPNEICSPHELIGWVDNVLAKLETKFDRIEHDVLDRLDLLGKRIDSLEISMSSLLDSTASVPTSAITPTQHQQSTDPAAKSTSSTPAT